MAMEKKHKSLHGVGVVIVEDEHVLSILLQQKISLVSGATNFFFLKFLLSNSRYCTVMYNIFALRKIQVPEKEWEQWKRVTEITKRLCTTKGYLLKWFITGNLIVRIINIDHYEFGSRYVEQFD